MRIPQALRSLVGTRWLQALWIAAIVVALLMTLLPMPEQAPRFAHADKVFHTGYFLLLGALAVLSQRGQRAARIAALAMVGLGIAIEIVQHFLPWRSFEWLDMLADSVGVAIGYAFSTWLRSR